MHVLLPITESDMKFVKNFYTTRFLGQKFYTPEQEKVRQHGIGAESRSRTVYAKLESNSEPARARVCQKVAVRASESQSGSHREP